MGGEAYSVNKTPPANAAVAMQIAPKNTRSANHATVSEYAVGIPVKCTTSRAIQVLFLMVLWMCGGSKCFICLTFDFIWFLYNLELPSPSGRDAPYLTRRRGLAGGEGYRRIVSLV